MLNDQLILTFYVHSSYLFEQTVVSVVRSARDPVAGNGVTLVLHNTPGRNVWTMAMQYLIYI